MNLSKRRRPLEKHSTGLALIEFVLSLLVFLLLLSGVIEFGRIIFMQQVIINLSREGANLVSRGTTFDITLRALEVSSFPLDIKNQGTLIISRVEKADELAPPVITRQEQGGGGSEHSRIGLPYGLVSLPDPDLAWPYPLYAAEVFMPYSPVTPLASLLDHADLFDFFTLYHVAYF